MAEQQSQQGETTGGFVPVWAEGPNYLMFATKELGPYCVIVANGNADQAAKIIRQYMEEWAREALYGDGKNRPNGITAPAR